MVTNFNEIFEKIRNTLIIENKIGYINNDFISELSTLLTTVKPKKTKIKYKFASNCKISLELIQNEYLDLMSDIINPQEKSVVKLCSKTHMEIKSEKN